MSWMNIMYTSLEESMIAPSVKSVLKRIDGTQIQFLSLQESERALSALRQRQNLHGDLCRTGEHWFPASHFVLRVFQHNMGDDYHKMLFLDLYSVEKNQWPIVSLPLCDKFRYDEFESVVGVDIWLLLRAPSISPVALTLNRADFVHKFQQEEIIRVTEMITGTRRTRPEELALAYLQKEELMAWSPIINPVFAGWGKSASSSLYFTGTQETL